ncbi:MAG: AMP-binding protein, partial [bacterium]|nr:AMP-binding protein [bacterium]
DEKRTREVFIEDPFKEKKGIRLYKTGDLARWLADGNIEFLGRIDQQVKIRGFRSELGEIERSLLAHHHIKDAVVLARESKNGDKYLCAYYVENKTLHLESATRHPTSGISPFGLKDLLSQTLPNYMIPAHYIEVEKIPLTHNGKIDRKALTQIPITNIQYPTHIAPKNNIEKKLAEIWGEILGLENEKISMDEDFFNIGGHSLRATVMATRIHKEFNARLPLVEIFKNSTIRTLAGILNEYVKEKYASITPAEKKDYYVVSSAQKRQYVLQLMELKNTVYNMPQIIPLANDTEPLKLQEVFKKLIRRHESFRTTFLMKGGTPVQKVHPTVPFKIEIMQPTTDGSDSEQLTAAQRTFFRPFDLGQAPLLRVGMLKLKPAPAGPTSKTLRQTGKFLLLDMHHIITDGTSQEVLIKEFFAINDGENLPLLKLQYKDYAEWQNSNKQTELMKRQEETWLKIFAGELPVLNLPTDYPRPEIQSFEGKNISFALNKNKTGNLKKLAKENEITLYMAILSIFTILLSKLSALEDIIVGTPTAGRRHADLENIIGMFVNTLATRNYPNGDKTIEEYLREVKENTLQAFENQEYQFEELVDRLSMRRDTGRNPLFDVMFNLLTIPTGKPAENKPQPIVPATETPDLIRDLPTDSKDSVINRTSKFDLTLTCMEKERVDGGKTDSRPGEMETLEFQFEYSVKLFKEGTIRRYIAYFTEVLQAVATKPGGKIGDIEIITAEEKEMILYEFNETAVDYPREKTIHQLFGEQVERPPDHLARVGREKPVDSRQYAVGKEKP